jgi:hypothetical protein
MFEKETLDDVVIYLLQKGRSGPDEIVEIIYTADLYHLILLGRTIINSIKDRKYHLLKKEDIEKIITDVTGKTSEFKYLSETDEKALDFAMDRYDLEIDAGVYPIPTCFVRGEE